MLLNSLAFLIFTIIFYTIWPFVIRKPRLSWVFLTVASLIFFSWGSLTSALLLAFTGLIAYLAGLWLDRRADGRKFVLLAAISTIVLILAVAKYREFLAENVLIVLEYMGFQLKPASPDPAVVRVIPLGISFYSLQAISYLVDLYNRRTPSAQNIFHFFAYLAMFPKLLAGPIERGKNLLPQLEQPSVPDEAQRWNGLQAVVLGYFLKFAVADNLAPLVDNAFQATILSMSSTYWWAIITAFAFQLYFDFLGYSWIAIGLGKWMGVNLTLNFHHPYTSTSIGEFWTRWHITLSNWLKDYIFFPISRSRYSRGHTHLAMWITMIASGLWHGAAWTFVIWGALHALWISLERASKWPAFLNKLRGGRWLALGLTLLQLWVAWVFFRAVDLNQAIFILRQMFAFSGPPVFGLDANGYIWILFGIIYELGFFT